MASGLSSASFRTTAQRCLPLSAPPKIAQHRIVILDFWSEVAAAFDRWTGARQEDNRAAAVNVRRR